MGDDRGLAELVAGAALGDQSAWDRLVDRFIPLVRHVVQSFRLAPQDADDACQSVWLRLVDHIGDIREPLALPGWISTTARNECLTLLRSTRRSTPIGDAIDSVAEFGVDYDPTEQLHREERTQALLEGLAELPRRHHELLVLLLTDPPVSYDEIAHRLGMAKGSIGPSRARALQRLRETRSMAALIDR